MTVAVRTVKSLRFTVAGEKVTPASDAERVTSPGAAPTGVRVTVNEDAWTAGAVTVEGAVSVKSGNGPAAAKSQGPAETLIQGVLY